MFNLIEIKSRVRGIYRAFFIDDIADVLSLNTNTDKNIFIIDENVFRLYKNYFEKLNYIIILPSEKNKTIDFSKNLINLLLEKKVRKDSCLIAIGGGIIQDIVAFVASIIFRGVDWKFIPTTLLAQADSCIGSKSSINFEGFKNLLGTFNPPNDIYICNDFINTLTDSEIKSGIGEMYHYFLVKNYRMAKELSLNYDYIIKDRDLLKAYIYESLLVKKEVIEIDEFDTSERHIFNYGHTFGHALESITNYQIPHGQAISLGMDLANFISLKLNLLSLTTFKELHNVIEKNIPNFDFNSKNVNEFISALKRDKKNKNNQLGCILSRGPEKMEKYFLTFNDFLTNTILDYTNKF